jgi:anti-repressor protein
MKNEVFNFGNHEVRIVIAENNEPMFVAKEICDILGYSNSRDAVSKHVDIEDKGVAKHDTLGGNQKLSIINESGLYALIFGSKLESAKSFKKWVTSEVLPTIRRHGMYANKQTVEEMLENPDVLIATLQNLKKEREEKERLQIQNELQNKQLKISAPKVEYYDEVLQSKSTYTTNQIAKEIGMSAIGLNVELNSLGIQYKQSGTWLLYHKYQNKGYTKTKTHTYTDNHGNTQTSMITVWTEKGRLFIHDNINIRKAV